MISISDRITLSIVSHGQASMIECLLRDLAKLKNPNIEVIITVNISEDESIYGDYPFSLLFIRNDAPRGFGANHNYAFSQSTTKWFAVVNPDIRINSLNFQVLMSPFESQAVGAVAPIVFSGDGSLEDSARKFPTVTRLTRRILLGQRNTDYKICAIPFSVDWVAGMFVVFRRDAFHGVGGFDDRRFYMYLEDADICRRIGKKGWQVILNPDAKVIHMAQRASRHNLKHMRWHAVSAFRFLTGL